MEHDTSDGIFCSVIRLLERIVKNDAQRVPMAGPHAADPMAMLDPIGAARTLHRALMHGKDHRIPWRSGTTSARDCMRGRCSVRMNSPPVKSRSGSDSRIAI